MTDWLSFCCLFAFGFSSLSSDEWQNKYWNWNNSIQTFILPCLSGPCHGRAISYYIIVQFDMLHDYANVCLLVVFLFFFNSPFWSIVLSPREKFGASLDSRIGIECNGHNRLRFLMKQLFPAKLSTCASFFICRFIVNTNFSYMLASLWENFPLLLHEEIIYMLLFLSLNDPTFSITKLTLDFVLER